MGNNISCIFVYTKTTKAVDGVSEQQYYEVIRNYYDEFEKRVVTKVWLQQDFLKGVHEL